MASTVTTVRQKNIPVGKVTEHSDLCLKNSIVASESWKKLDKVITDFPTFIGLTTIVQVETAGAVLHCIRPAQWDPSVPCCYDLLTQTRPLFHR